MKQLRKNEIKRFFKKQPKRYQEIVLVLENIEYARNVAALFRTADAAGVSKIYLTGVTETPPFGKNLRNASRNKERVVPWGFQQNTQKLIGDLKNDGYKIVAVELTDKSIHLQDLSNRIKGFDKICLVAGSEVFGVTKSTLPLCDLAVYIPMFGKGASLNVAASVAIVLYSF